MITQDRLKKLLEYNPETGVFRWRESRKGVRNNGTAGSMNKRTGTRSIGIDCKKYLEHRLAWLYVYGEFPTREIDHINGDPSDNRIKNLRDVDHRTNCKNFKAHRDGKTPGVRYVGNGRFQSYAMIKGKRRHIGMYATEKEAQEAYEQITIKYTR